MADYHIGLDFGTSQTKVCLLNKDSNVREFIKFDNNTFFLPSIIVKKENNTFSYGDEAENGIKYRYFKMAAAEDDELIQVTHEDLQGNLEYGTVDDFRKYSTDYKIKPDILVVLFLAYTYLFIKQQKSIQSPQIVSGLLGRLLGNNTVTQNTFSINLGIPTEWNNPNHIKRKIKFQSLLITSVDFACQFDSLNSYLNTKETVLLDMISKINEIYLSKLVSKLEREKEELIKQWLGKYKLSVFPESAAGVNYLLKTRRLANGTYATLDIGAGTSDFALFQVSNNSLTTYYCSESVEIASNDFYREYARQLYSSDSISFDEIKETENAIREYKNINYDFYNVSRKIVRGFLSDYGIEFAVRKTFFRKFYLRAYKVNKIGASTVINGLNESPIIVFGGGANIEGFCSGKYCFYVGSNPFGNQNKSFIARPITDYVKQVDISDKDADVQKYINLLVLALGLTYGEQNHEYIPFFVPQDTFRQTQEDGLSNDRYFYYDLQSAVYK